MALKIEAGKKYRNKKGQIAYVQAVVDGDPFNGGSRTFEASGRIKGYWPIYHWKEDGSVADREITNSDLVSEYREPRQFEVTISEDCCGNISAKAAEIHKDTPNPGESCCCGPTSYTINYDLPHGKVVATGTLTDKV